MATKCTALIIRNPSIPGELIASLRQKLKAMRGFDPTYISGIERGLRNPGIKNVSKIVKALKITTSELRSVGEP